MRLTSHLMADLRFVWHPFPSCEMVKLRMPVSAYLKAGLFVVAAATALFGAAGKLAIPGF